MSPSANLRALGGRSMRRETPVRCLALAGMLLAACGGSSSNSASNSGGYSGNGGGTGGSCAAGTVCTEYDGTPYPTLQETCAATGTTYAAASCPTANRVGRCTVNGYVPGNGLRYYYTTSYYSGDPATLAQNCSALSGVWVAG